MGRNRIIGGVGIITLLLGSSAFAQNLFGGGSTAFDPQISTVNSGAVLDARPVVSHDLKYVTITAQPSASQLLALRTFPINIPPNLGFVGSAAIQDIAARERGMPAKRVIPTPSPLDHIGIIKLD